MGDFVVESVVAEDGDVVGGVGENHVVPGGSESGPSLVEYCFSDECAFVFYGVEEVVFEEFGGLGVCVVPAVVAVDDGGVGRSDCCRPEDGYDFGSGVEGGGVGYEVVFW